MSDEFKIGDTVIHRSQLSDPDVQHMTVEDAGQLSVLVSWIDRGGSGNRTWYPKASLVKVIAAGQKPLTADGIQMAWRATVGEQQAAVDTRHDEVHRLLVRAKELAVESQLFDEAASIRDISDKLKKRLV